MQLHIKLVLIKLTRNKRRFYQQGMRAATLIRSISIASLSPPQGVNLPLVDFRCSKNESTGHEMRLSRSFLQANLDAESLACTIALNPCSTHIILEGGVSYWFPERKLDRQIN